jgi:hypothetical protein
MHYSKVLNEMDLQERIDNFVDFLEDDEIEVLDSLCKSQELTRVQMFRQMLRLYQSVHDGYATITPNHFLKLKNPLAEKTITLHGYGLLENAQRMVTKDQKVYCQIIMGKDVYFEIKDDKAHLTTRERATELGWGNYGEIYENH